MSVTKFQSLYFSQKIQETFQCTLVFETFLKLAKLQCKCKFYRNQVLLLNIDHFEPNQIFSYLRGGYTLRNHLSCVTCHVQHVTFRPFPNLKSYGTANFLVMFTTLYHVSCVPCHMSGVTCHNFFLFFLLQSGGVCLCRVCY